MADREGILENWPGVKVTRVNPELLALAGAGATAAKKAHKYHAQPTMVDGVRFDSKREAERWVELKSMEAKGEIAGLRRQVKKPLLVDGEFIGLLVIDFQYHENGNLVYEDVKSPATKTAIWVWKSKHFTAQYGKEIRVVE